MVQQIFVGDAARLLQCNNLHTFSDVWNVQADWFEPPNASRGGWSGACRVLLKTAVGGSLAVFLKRQQNHCTRSLRAPLGMPTFRREFNNIETLRRVGVPAVPALYYGEETIDDNSCAAIITVALDTYSSLDAWWPSHDDPVQRQQVMDGIAHWTAQLSRRRLQHGCLYSKHIFIRNTGAAAITVNDLSLIDLESMRRRFTINRAARMNRDQLLRRTPVLNDAEHGYLDRALSRALAQLKNTQ